MQITVHRGCELWREAHCLPAATYNLARTLQLRSPHGVAFVPIRSLQVLAIIDVDEFVFVDNHERAWALLTWEKLRTEARNALDEPLRFEAVGYSELARDAMRRLPREFHEALCTLSDRLRAAEPAQLLAFAPRRRANG